MPCEAWLVSETKFYELYTPEEKAKLYSAIGYEENEADPTLPVEVSHTDSHVSHTDSHMSHTDSHVSHTDSHASHTDSHVSHTVVDRFSVALFSALQQPHCALASCDYR